MQLVWVVCARGPAAERTKNAALQSTRNIKVQLGCVRVGLRVRTTTLGGTSRDNPQGERP